MSVGDTKTSAFATLSLFKDGVGSGARHEETGDLYERFLDAGKGDVFLDALIPHILHGEVQTVPPAVARDLFTYVRSNPSTFEPGFLETLILRMDPSSLDIHSTLGLCVSEGWYTASAHIWNKALKDFVSPVIEQFDTIREIVMMERSGTPPLSDAVLSAEKLPLKADHLSASQDRRISAYRIFVYLAYILTGRSYPSGVPMDGMTARTARNGVYSFLFSRGPQRWPPVGGKLIAVFVGQDQSRGALNAGVAGEDPSYPYLRMLIKFDPGETLRVLGIAMDDPYMDGEDLFDREDEGIFDGAYDATIGTQGIIDALLSLAEEEVEVTPKPDNAAPADADSHATTSTWALRFSERSRVYAFIIRMAAKYRDKICLHKNSLHRAVIALTTNTDPSTHEEREVAIEALWSSRLYVPGTQAEQTRLAELYEKAGFYRVLDKIYRQEGRYDLVIGTYLADKRRREEVFDAIIELLGPSVSGLRLSDAQIADVRNAAMARIADLVDVDGFKSAELVKNHIGVPHAEALARLKSDAEKQAAFLRGLLDACKFEKTLLGVANVLVGRDLFEKVQEDVQGRAKGWRASRSQCAACGRTMWTMPDFGIGLLAFAGGQSRGDSGNEDFRSIVVFRCGHGYHRRCLPDHLFDSCLVCRHISPRGMSPEGVHCGSRKKGKQRAVD